ncbi:MAG: DUF4383 domain-containing protein [Candidatus Peribacteraceae bacterium]
MNLLVKPVTGLLGLALTIVGIAGFFVPSGMFYMFEVDTVHNIVHFGSGLIGLFAFNSSQLHSRWFLILFGLVYAVITIAGFSMDGYIFGLFSTNSADNYLHLAISALCLIVGFGSEK